MRKVLVALVVLGLAAAANASLIYSETFSYADGAIDTVSGGLWTNHSGTIGTLFVVNNALQVNQNQTEDANRPLGSTYSSGSIYYSLTISVTTRPTAAGTYFAELQTGSSSFRDRLFVQTNGVTSGDYLFGIGNGSSVGTLWTAGLTLNTTYTLVVRSDLDTDTTWLWVNPIDESSASVTSTVASTVNPTAFGFRQAAGEGVMVVDNLNVGTTFNDVVPEPGTMGLFGMAMAGMYLLRKRFPSRQS